MKPTILLALLLSTSCTSAQPTPDTEPTDFPKGAVTQYTFDHSTIFPGTTRKYWIYVPAQYDPAHPACLFVDQDKIQFNAPTVFDRLIAEHKIPVTIAVFVAPGILKSPTTQALDRFNRSYEFDSLSDNYVTFLINELLPDAESKSTPDGRPIKISHDPNDRAIGGSSSGAVAAFTAAWDRPDSFSRVFSAIGSYTNLRGANVYPLLIRKYEPKPIRIFLQDGSADHNHYAGDWWMANQEMERALVSSGYEVNHVWGTGDHDHIQANQIFPDAMTWLWHDYPTPVKPGLGSDMLQSILIPGEGWHELPGTYKSTDNLTPDSQGNVYFDADGNVDKIALDGAVSPYLTDSKKGALSFTPDGRVYAVLSASNEIATLSPDDKYTPVATDLHVNDFIVTPSNDLYITAAGSKPGTTTLWHVTPTGQKTEIDPAIKSANGLALSPDHSLLYVDDYHSHWAYSYQIAPDGGVSFKQRFYDLYVRDTDDDAGCDGMKVDRDGRLYVSTRAGIQVCDQAGRVLAIIPTPNGKVSNLCFGGPNFDTLYATCGDKVFFRKLKTRGLLSSSPPIKPAPPKL